MAEKLICTVITEFFFYHIRQIILFPCVALGFWRKHCVSEVGYLLGCNFVEFFPNLFWLVSIKIHSNKEVPSQKKHLKYQNSFMKTNGQSVFFIHKNVVMDHEIMFTSHHVSHVTCHVSCVRCPVYFFHQVLQLVGGGSGKAP